MRISTSMIFNSGATNLQQLQGSMYQIQNQMSTGRRVLTPADDPVAAAQALVVSQNQSVNKQFIDNQGNAGSQLSLIENRLSSISDLIVSVKDRVVQAGNGSYGDKERTDIAAEIRQRYDELIGLANSSDAMGQYVFSGFRGNTQPFSTTGSPGNRTATYAGDGGQRQIQVSSGRLMDVSEAGSNIFMNIPQGNGKFMFTAGGANTGTGALGASSMISGYDGSTYQLTFTAPNTYTLAVTNSSGVTTTTPGQTYTTGSQIVLGPAGQQLQIAISGSPAVGDSFSVAPSSNQDIFQTLDNMIKALEGNVSTNDSTKATFKNQMAGISDSLDQALERVLTAQTSIGARQTELDSLGNSSSDLDLQYKTDLSSLQDLDYTKAASDLTSQKMVLEAAQLSFKQVSQMSLFNFL
ncbi:MAG: flagellar hook-associated protein FlgL [Bacteroidota bacterium]